METVRTESSRAQETRGSSAGELFWEMKCMGMNSGVCSCGFINVGEWLCDPRMEGIDAQVGFQTGLW